MSSSSHSASAATQANLPKNVLASPDNKKLKGALAAARAPSRRIVKQISKYFLFCPFSTGSHRWIPVLDHMSIAVTLYQPHVTFEELIEDSASKLLLDPASSIYRQLRTTLTFRSSPIMRYGSFKLAFHANSSEIVLGNSTAVYLKQTYYKSVQTGEAKSHDPANQIKYLIMEIVCLVWADTLLKLVYNFMEGQDHHQPEGQECGQNIPVIPQLHFTSCALACSDDRNNIYLVEEFIDEKVEGRFRKYINNSSALVSLSHLRGEEAINIAKFLSFSQHVQYLKTKGLAYISDYQGVIYIH